MLKAVSSTILSSDPLFLQQFNKSRPSAQDVLQFQLYNFQEQGIDILLRILCSAAHTICMNQVLARDGHWCLITWIIDRASFEDSPGLRAQWKDHLDIGTGRVQMGHILNESTMQWGGTLPETTIRKVCHHRIANPPPHPEISFFNWPSEASCCWHDSNSYAIWTWEPC